MGIGWEPSYVIIIVASQNLIAANLFVLAAWMQGLDSWKNTIA